MSIALPGGGLYDENSLMQRRCVEASFPTLAATLKAERKLLTSHPVLTVADFGCAEGGNSIFAMKYLLDQVRLIDEKLQVLIIHEDLPLNDWRRVVSNAEKEYSKYPNAFFAGCGRSFYKQVMPANSVCFGFSSIAIHWLSALPPRTQNQPLLKNHLVPCHSDLVSAQERALFAKQSQQDLITFLKHRSVEIIDQGVLMMVNMANSGGAEHFNLPVLGMMNEVLHDLVKAGMITEEERQNCILPIFGRTKQDFYDGAKATGWEMTFYEEKVISCVFLDELREQKQKQRQAAQGQNQDRSALDFSALYHNFVKRYVGFVEGFSETVIAESFPKSKSDQVCKEFYRRLGGKLYDAISAPDGEQKFERQACVAIMVMKNHKKPQ